ncbi:MAG: hypothetical protein A2156_04420 [Deltaproteobacteria bacterium RBG_16_48_10]|nr:MAG: hypothetical protein A2156_04420 [Deltaproteobacteria bacterium RBG_16_48_10]
MSKQTKRILAILSLVLIFSIAMGSFGIAYTGGVRGIGLLGISFFFTVGIVIVLAQVIPASILFCMVISSVFSTFRRNEMPIRAT